MSEGLNQAQCSFCMETFMDPRILKGCSHSICLSCAEFQFSSQLSSLFASPNTSSSLKGVSKSSQGKSDGNNFSKGIPIMCCKCNAKTFIPLESSPEKELPKNYDLNELLQPSKDECSNRKCSQEAIYGCVDCMKIYCQKHREFHDEALDDHQCLSVKDYKEKMGKGSDIVKCKDHQILCHYFCKDCNSMVCNVCKDDEHSYHQIKLWKQEKDELKVKTNQKIEDLKKRRDAMDEIKEETKKKQVEVKKKHEITMKEIDNFQNQAITFIQNKCNQMREKYDEDYNNQLKKLQVQQQNIEKMIKEIDRLMKLNQDDLDTPNSIIQHFNKLSHYSHQIQSIPSSIHFGYMDIQINHRQQQQIESSLLEWFDKQCKITQNSYTISSKIVTANEAKLVKPQSWGAVIGGAFSGSEVHHFDSSDMAFNCGEIKLKGELRKIAGEDMDGFHNLSMQYAMFNHPYFLKFNQSSKKLFVSDNHNHIIRSINNISMNNFSMNNNDKWNGELKIEVGQPKQEGYSNGDRNTCKLRRPRGFDWDMDDNIYICNDSYICKVDSKSNQVSLVAGDRTGDQISMNIDNVFEARFNDDVDDFFEARFNDDVDDFLCLQQQPQLFVGHATCKRYKDGNNHEARFHDLAGILCYQRTHQNYQLPHQRTHQDYQLPHQNYQLPQRTHQNYQLLHQRTHQNYQLPYQNYQQNHQSPLVFYECNNHCIELYVCDSSNHCIRMINVTNGKTTTFAGKGKENGDVDGTLQSARFHCPYDIVKDDENDHILYVSDTNNNKIKMINTKKGMVTTLVGGKNDTSILYFPNQMQIIDSFIYVACSVFKDCIVKIDKHSKQVTRIKFNDGKQVLIIMMGITYHELDQCFYISDWCNIYKLE